MFKEHPDNLIESAQLEIESIRLRLMFAASKRKFFNYHR